MAKCRTTVVGRRRGLRVGLIQDDLQDQKSREGARRKWKITGGRTQSSCSSSLDQPQSLYHPKSRRRAEMALWN